MAMQILLSVVIAVHVVAGVFWAGSTFVLARNGGAGAEQLARPQMGAATLTLIAGLVMWGLVHRYSFHLTEAVLALGAVCAIIAAGLQEAVVLPATRRLAASAANPTDASMIRRRIASAERAAAALLMVTVISMAISRYV